MSHGLNLPGLHRTASELSDQYQAIYLWLIRGEYILLVIAAVLSLDFSYNSFYFLVYALVFVFAMTLLLTRSLMKPEQTWYRARAVAESIKTSAWRFAMLAHPYDAEEANKLFLNLIREVVQANKVLSKLGIDPGVEPSQVTAQMESVRCLPLKQKVAFYLKNRVGEQRKWYLKKARQNRSYFIYWTWASGLAYVIAIVCALSRIAFPNWQYVPTEPLIVAASSAVGWIQIRKHSELATSYTLTATEIGIAAEEAKNFSDPKSFSDFVNDTELAFSREHTQWVARQQTAG